MNALKTPVTPLYSGISDWENPRDYFPAEASFDVLPTAAAASTDS